MIFYFSGGSAVVECEHPNPPLMLSYFRHCHRDKETGLPTGRPEMRLYRVFGCRGYKPPKIKVKRKKKCRK